ncbi:MAG: TRAP transporter fused permease subunit [Pseudomonadota bacterium]
MPDRALTMLDTDPKPAARTFAFGALVVAVAVVEVIIALQFNLLRYPTIPVGVADLTWARALLMVGLLGYGWSAARYARDDPRARTTAIFAAAGLALAAADAAIGFQFNSAAPVEGEVALHPSIARIGEFNIRVVPAVVLSFALTGLVTMQRLGDAGAMGRLTVVLGLLVGITGLLSVLPALPFRNIGIGDYNLREVLGPLNRVFRSSFRIGPASPSEVYNAAMFMASATIAVVSMGRSEDDLPTDGNPRRDLMRWLDWAALALLGYACFQYVFQGVAQMSFTTADAHAALIGCLTVLYLCFRVFGAPLALCGLAALLYFFFSESMPGIFNAQYSGYASLADNLWFNNSKAVLGSQLGILLNNVLPFIIFGALLSATGAARSLITIAFYAMRNTRGGAAHAAVLASGLFGSVSGSAVSNVVGTGVITIPMIKKRGYAPEFAGGVEATASTGGQIMPPIMGAAALVMADLTGTRYLDILIAALVPALAYYLSLFVTVVFESRRMNMQVQAANDLDPVTRQDILNVVLLVVVPLFVVIWRLVQGASPAGSALTAILAVLLLSVISPTVRARPVVLLRAIADGGVTFGRLLMVVGVVGIIVAVMSTTDLPSKMGREIADFANIALVITLAIGAVVSLLLGMGMPTLPAYLTVIIILGPALNSLGLSVMTSHMFVFYFGVASAITPPVAVAAFAAAAIAGGKPIATGVTAVRIGIVIFAVPFMFALNPDMLIVAPAYNDPDAVFSVTGFVSVLGRTAFMIYLLASATSRFDSAPLAGWEVVARFAAAIFLISPTFYIHGVAAVAGVALLAMHHYGRDGKSRQAT